MKKSKSKPESGFFPVSCVQNQYSVTYQDPYGEKIKYFTNAEVRDYFINLVSQLENHAVVKIGIVG